MVKAGESIESVEEAMVPILRHKTEAERLAIAWRMWKSARDMLHCLLRAEHPEWPEAAVRQEAARRLAHGAR